MDLTSRLIEREQAPQTGSKWPVLALAAGAILGTLMAIGGTRVNMDMMKATEGEPLRARLTVMFGPKMIHTEIGTDIQRMLRARSTYAISSLAIGLVGGGVMGFSSFWILNTIAVRFFLTDMNMAPTPMMNYEGNSTPIPTSRRQT